MTNTRIHLASLSAPLVNYLCKRSHFWRRLILVIVAHRWTLWPTWLEFALTQSELVVDIFTTSWQPIILLLKHHDSIFHCRTCFAIHYKRRSDGGGLLQLRLLLLHILLNFIWSFSQFVHFTWLTAHHVLKHLFLGFGALLMCLKWTLPLLLCWRGLVFIWMSLRLFS